MVKENEAPIKKRRKTSASTSTAEKPVTGEELYNVIHNSCT